MGVRAAEGGQGDGAGRPSLPGRANDEWLLVSGSPAAVSALLAAMSAQEGVGATWTSDQGEVALIALGPVPDATGVPVGLHVGPDGAVAVKGQLRRTGTRWTAPATWAARIAADLRHPYDDPFDGVSGDGCIAVVDRLGRGVAVADPIGLANLYRGTAGEVQVVGTRPSAVSAALAACGRATPWDPTIGVWFALTGGTFAAASSVVGVERLQSGARVIVRGDVVTVRDERPWAEPRGLEALGPEELVDVAEEVIVDHLRAAIALSPDRPTLDLTGGKDSRVLLAVAHARIGLDHFRVSTVGEPTAPDVAAAALIAAHLGVRHESGIVLRPPSESFARRVDRFVDLTDGMHSAWMFVLPHGDPSVVRISGTTGEILRGSRMEEAWVDSRAPGPPTLDEVADTVVAAYRRGSGGLVRPDVEGPLLQAVRDDLAGRCAAGVPPDGLLQDLYVRHHGARFAGLRLDLEPDHRVRPLADLTLLRIAHLLGPERRVAEDLHHSLVERCSPLLASIPFVNGRWRGDRPSRPVPPPPASADAAPAAAPVAPGEGGFSALGIAQTRPDEQRREFVRQAFADDVNPIWEVADRAAVKAAVEGFDGLRMKPRQQLYGLATTARCARLR